MFRLTNKGSQSRKNHKIINQTTKISESDQAIPKSSLQIQMEKQIRELEEKARIEAEEAQKIMLQKEQQQKEEQQRKSISEAAPVAVTVVPKAPEYSLSDMETYIRKMTEYVNHMQMLEKRNQLLESENSRIQEVNGTTVRNKVLILFLGKQSSPPRNGGSHKIGSHKIAAGNHRRADPEVLPELPVELAITVSNSNSQYLLVSSLQIYVPSYDSSIYFHFKKIFLKIWNFNSKI